MLPSPSATGRGGVKGPLKLSGREQALKLFILPTPKDMSNQGASLPPQPAAVSGSQQTLKKSQNKRGVLNSLARALQTKAHTSRSEPTY